MNLKKKLFLLIPFLLSSCNTNRSSELELYNNIIFKTNEGESKTHITKELQEPYFYFMDKKPFQAPIFLLIEHNNYSIYVGIPVGTCIDEIALSGFLEDAQVISGPNSDFLFYTYQRYRYDLHYISEYTINIEDNLLFLFAITNSKNVSDSTLNFNELSSRFFIK